MNLITRISYLSCCILIYTGILYANDLALHSEMGKNLQIKTWASSPMIQSPVSIDVDPQGRIWAVEILPNGSKHVGQIVVLSDTNQDGKADKKVIFGPKYNSIPLGIAVFDNVIIVSMGPELTAFTDTNRNGIFEEGIDKKNILMSGFHGRHHDHGLHAVIGAPSGRLHFTHGNIGADIKTKDGKEFHVSSYYSQNYKSIGLKSSDGHRYVGGFGMSMKPDGTDAQITYSNTRNTHDMFVSSFGDMFHVDNDDPAHCRAAWAMKHGNFGYASLENGSRSWEESGKSWEESQPSSKELARRGDSRINKAHWRQTTPGTMPAGYVYGAGAPTGSIFIEGDELGKALRGKYLVCETVRRAILSFSPHLVDAQIDMGKLDNLVTHKNGTNTSFMPSDVIVHLDGSLLISDWASRGNSRGERSSSGAIYRISRKDEKKVIIPTIDFNSTEGLLKALKSPAVNTRWVAARRLMQQAEAFGAIKQYYDQEDNPFYKARALWIMAQHTDEKALAFVKQRLQDSDEQIRLTALRAILENKKIDRMKILDQMSKDKSQAIKREVAVNLRDDNFKQCKDILKRLIKSYDGKNRFYLEALGTASSGKEDAIYKLWRNGITKDFKKWTAKEKNIAWRLRSRESLDDIVQVIIAQKPAIDEFRHLLMTFSLAYSKEEQEANFKRVMMIKKHQAFMEEDYQSTLQEILDKDLIDKQAIVMKNSFVIPKSFGEESKVGDAKQIAKLNGDPKRGLTKVGACLTCHKINGNGSAFGPNLSKWAQSRSVEAVIEDIINPGSKIAHGYEKAVIVKNNKYQIEGVNVGYAYHAGSIKVKTFGGVVVKIAFRRSGAKIHNLKNHTWMPSASKMGLSNQDVRDIVAYLKSL